MTDKGSLVPLNKPQLFSEWMRGDHVLVHLDARRSDVHVPEHLRTHSSLTLKLSYLFQGKTEHDDTAITSYLKFSGTYYECRLPWPAVWGMTSADGEQVVWPEDVPAEHAESSFVKEADKQARDTESTVPRSNTVPRSKPNLTTVHSFRPKEKAGNADDGEPPPAPNDSTERRKGLTRIK